ncbi:uncharacterized protein LOC105257483 [Camponotus floridanus]|uniref:uncharacterized protein LOC105257483 n=1 Tax=Camponotus floridanus TaxID=104421 RepID=UPI000DC68105|nr:uncharacterized protein LOC105257483 [Camponotus floridanus]
MNKSPQNLKMINKQKKSKIISIAKLQPLPSKLDHIVMETLGSGTTVSKSNQFASTSDNAIDNEASEFINNATKKICDKNIPTIIPTTSKQSTTISDNVSHNETSKYSNIITNKTSDTIYEDDNDDDFDLENPAAELPVHTKPIIISLDARNNPIDVNENDINISIICKGTSQTVLMNKRTSKTTRSVNNIIANRCNCCPCINKINRKLDIIIQHILQSKNRNEGNNNTQLENVEFCQLQTKELMH